MRTHQWLSVTYLVAFLAFLLGVSLMALEVWPHGVVVSLREYVAGHAEEGTDAREKLLNDFNVRPSRHLATLGKMELRPQAMRSVEISGLRARRQLPLLHVTEEAPAGYRVIFGPFDFEENLHGAILVDESGECLHTWQIDFDEIQKGHETSELQTYPHGFLVLPDGSILFGFDNNLSVTRMSWNSEVMWSRKGRHHHALSLSADGTHLWAFDGLDMVKLSLADGTEVHRVHFEQLWQANKEGADVIGMASIDSSKGSHFNFPLGEDGFHPNDVEPLSPKLAEAFPQFEAGDLAVSYRDLNLVFVLDPETGQIKWWRAGAVRRQHDPDWQPDGTLSIFDNNMHRGWAKIVKIDPETFETQTILDGERYRFHSWHRGKHQITEDGYLVITSSVQGRVLEVDPEGKVVFDFFNRFDGQEVLMVSEAVWVAPGYFDESVPLPWR
ncbi:MAG: arylsulfotransferase family protein [Opitutales bacterium]